MLQEIGIGLNVASMLFGAQGEEDAAEARAAEIAQNETYVEWALQNQTNNLKVNEWLPVGIAQRRAEQWKLKSDMVISTITAHAAASGGGNDPGIINLIAKIESQGRVNAQTELATGLMQQRATREQIKANDWSIKAGAAAATAGINNTLSAGRGAAAGTILSGATDLFAKYGKSLFTGSGVSAGSQDLMGSFDFNYG